MKCTVCQQGTLVPCFIEEQFRGHQCSACGGHWLLIEDYVRWRELESDGIQVKDGSFDLEETKRALICPVSGTLMQKYRFTLDNEHRLDFSPKVGGVWLDKGEWDFLKQLGLAGSLGQIFTDHWQRQLRQDGMRASLESVYLQKFGDADYERLKELREWLQSHPSKHDMRAFLLADDPYSATS